MNDSGTERESPGEHRHAEQMKRAMERDFERRRRRDTSGQSFWRSLGVLGMVGWPLAITTVGAAWLGHFLDVRWNTGIQFTLLLLVLGVVMGSLVVWQVVGGHQR